jgi:hypothetical protein
MNCTVVPPTITPTAPFINTPYFQERDSGNQFTVGIITSVCPSGDVCNTWYQKEFHAGIIIIKSGLEKPKQFSHCEYIAVTKTSEKATVDTAPARWSYSILSETLHTKRYWQGQNQLLGERVHQWHTLKRTTGNQWLTTGLRLWANEWQLSTHSHITSMHKPLNIYGFALKLQYQTIRTAVQWYASPLPSWKSTSTNFCHKTYDPKYFHRFSPDLQAILCDIPASVRTRDDKDLSLC